MAQCSLTVGLTCPSAVCRPFIKEVQILSSARHPNILQVLAALCCALLCCAVLAALCDSYTYLLGRPLHTLQQLAALCWLQCMALAACLRVNGLQVHLQHAGWGCSKLPGCPCCAVLRAALCSSWASAPSMAGQCW